MKSQRYCDADTKFINAELALLLTEGAIDPSSSLWSAQVLIVDVSHKKVLVIDYSLTINKNTLLDAYPLPNVNEL